MPKKTLIIAIIILAAGFFYYRGLNSPVDLNGREENFTVVKGESAAEIANNLRTNNLIRSVLFFKFQIWRSRLSIQAGEYSLSPKLTTREIIRLLSSGQALSREKSIVMIEGWNLKDMAVYLEKNGLFATADFLSLAQAPLSAWKFDFAKPDFLSDAPKSAGLEGYLFPDTYRVDKQATAPDIIKKMLGNFDNKLTPSMRQEIKRQDRSVYEIITMASVLEKEVRTAEDMKIVSGIFWDRMKIGMPLQSDATLSYFLGDKIGSHTIAETKIDSPYNTYKYRGLPPGPIANPGLNAITAAIYPTATDYNYFLSDPDTGKTIFSKTLDEHNTNKARYLR